MALPDTEPPGAIAGPGDAPAMPLQ
jgi:hypothetical protein